MGCDIHCFAEIKKNGKWEQAKDCFSTDEFYKKFYGKNKCDSPFDHRNYSVFSFLAGVRNYDMCTPISEPKGLPDDLSIELKEIYKDWEYDAHSESFLTAKELLSFDYDKIFFNRRTEKKEGNVINGAAIADIDKAISITYRKNLGDFFFLHLSELEALGDPDDVRIVFWFDN